MVVCLFISSATASAEALLEHVTNQMTGATSGNTGASSMDMFINIHNMENGNGGIFTKNPSFWANEFNFSGVSIWNSYGWSGSGGTQRSGTLITPRHMIFANHFQVYQNQEFSFTDSSNTVHRAKLIDQKQVGNSDIKIGRLDKSIPSSVRPYRIIPAEDLIVQTYPYGFPFIIINQDKKAIIKQQRETMDLGNLFHKDPSNNSFSSLKYDLRSGDSGSPHLLPINGELFLIGTETSGWSGPLTGWYIKEINDTIASFGDSERISTYTPSQFPTQNIAPTLYYFNNNFQVIKPTYRLNEHSPVGTLIADFDGYDFNSGQTITYSISDEAKNFGMTIDPTSGQLKVSDQVRFDYVNNGEIIFTLTLTDNGTPTESNNYTIYVNLNNIDESTVFSNEGGAIKLISPRGKEEWVIDGIYPVTLEVANWVPGKGVYVYLYAYDEKGGYLKRTLITNKVINEISGQIIFDFKPSEILLNQFGEQNYIRIHPCDQFCATSAGKFGGIFDESDEYIQLHRTARGFDTIPEPTIISNSVPNTPTPTLSVAAPKTTATTQTNTPIINNDTSVTADTTPTNVVQEITKPQNQIQDTVAPVVEPVKPTPNIIPVAPAILPTSLTDKPIVFEQNITQNQPSQNISVNTTNQSSVENTDSQKRFIRRPRSFFKPNSNPIDDNSNAGEIQSTKEFPVNNSKIFDEIIEVLTDVFYGTVDILKDIINSTLSLLRIK